MYSPQKHNLNNSESHEFDTNRWTSSAYAIQFAKISIIEAEPEQEAAFVVSAWGLSKRLRQLLGDYTDGQIHSATRWLTIQQNALVADVLEQMQYSGHSIPQLEHLYISIDGELFLPNGLRMTVICVTNIVPNEASREGLDKFVAILDHSEVDTYVIERRGIGLPPLNNRIH